MATNDELAAQLDLMNKINVAMQAIATSARSVKSSYEAQFEFAQKTMKVMQQVANSSASSAVGALNDQLSTTAQNVGDLDADPFAKLAAQAMKASGSMESLGNRIFKTGARVNVFGSVVAGLVKGFRNVVALTKGVFGFFKGVADLAFSVSAAILAIPFRILSGLMDMAVSSPGTADLRREIEAVRKAFGDLKGPAASTIISTTKHLTGFAATGLHAYRVFGTLAERMQAVREVAVEMGATFGTMTEEFVQNGGALLAYQKGLGVSNEQMKGLASRAITTGKTMSKVLNDVTKQALNLGKTFSIDQKLIGRDMAEASKDVKNFGQLTVKELGVASVYARKLGVEIDKITGTLNAFKTFDTAAENAAKLSQQFGVQVDAFKMMEEQNPAAQIDMLRQQFKQAGVDASKFNRQQRELLALSTGLDEAVAQQVFSANNYGVSLKDITEKSQEAEKQQLSQAEAMSKLSDSIERMVKDGQQLEGSFFKMFLRGIDIGIKRSSAFRMLMLDIRRALRVTMHAGIAFGRIFVNSFDGVKESLGGLRKMFGPETFGKLGKSINDATKALLDKKNPLPFDKFAQRIFGGFRAFFAAEAGPLKETLEGFKKFFIKIADLVGPGVEWVGKQIGASFSLLADLISGKKPLPGLDTSGPKTFVGRLMQPIVKGIANAWPSIKEGFLKLMDVLGTELKKFIQNHPEIKEAGKKVVFGLATMLFGPAVMNGLIAFAVNALAGAVKNAIFGGVTKGAAEAGPTVTRTIMTSLGRTGGTIARGMGRVLGGPVAAAAAVILGPMAVHDVMSTYGKAWEKEFGVLDAKIAVGATGVLRTLTLNLLPDWLESAFGQTVATMTGWYSGVFESVFGPTIVNDFKSSMGTVVDFLDFFGAALTVAWEDTAAFFKDSWPFLKQLGIDIFTGLGDGIKWVFKPLADNFDWAYNKIKSGLDYLTNNPLVNKITSSFGKLGDKVSDALGGFSFTDMGEQFGNRLADRVVGGYDKVLREELPKKTAKAVKATPTATTPASSATSGPAASSAVAESLKKLKEAAPALDLDTSDFGDRMMNISKQISKAQTAIAKIKATAPALQRAVGDGGVKSALDSIRDVVALVQKLDDALSMSPSVDVSTKLERLASASGLGSKAQYTVKSKEVVINLNLTVTMDVGKVEKVMIMRQESIIRDRLNFATVTNPGSQGSQSIPETYSDKVPQITKR